MHLVQTKRQCRQHVANTCRLDGALRAWHNLEFFPTRCGQLCGDDVRNPIQKATPDNVPVAVDIPCFPRAHVASAYDLIPDMRSHPRIRDYAMLNALASQLDEFKVCVVI